VSLYKVEVLNIKIYCRTIIIFISIKAVFYLESILTQDNIKKDEDKIDPDKEQDRKDDRQIVNKKDEHGQLKEEYIQEHPEQ